MVCTARFSNHQNDKKYGPVFVKLQALCTQKDVYGTRAFISHIIDKLIYQINQLVGFPAKFVSSCISQNIFFHMIGNKSFHFICLKLGRFHYWSLSISLSVQIEGTWKKMFNRSNLRNCFSICWWFDYFIIKCVRLEGNYCYLSGLCSSTWLKNLIVRKVNLSYFKCDGTAVVDPMVKINEEPVKVIDKICHRGHIIYIKKKE